MKYEHTSIAELLREANLDTDRRRAEQTLRVASALADYRATSSARRIRARATRAGLGPVVVP